MRKTIFEGYGIAVATENDRYFISFDSGESSGSKLMSFEVSEYEALKAMESEGSAYEVILRRQRNTSK